MSKVETLADLARLLRRLRRRDARRRGDSELTYRELAAKTGWSHAVIGEYFTGKALPPTDRFDVLVRLLGAGPAELGVLATARDRVEERRRSAATAGPAQETTVPVVPRVLPADVAGFTGREGQLAELGALVSAGRLDTAMVISVLSGTAGVGKTALAVHWAHRVRNKFPDGQLYVNLRGFDAGGPAMAPAEAVRGFLDALNVPSQRIPVGLDAQAGLYRSLLSGKRMLIVLDNARDAEQVRPLLPGAPGCLVLVTSRNQLPGLVAAEGAHPIALDLLSTEDARELLVRRLGQQRVAAEPIAVREIVNRCARLPLALAIVAARAATHPRFALAALAGELREAGGLDAFAADDRATDVRAVFSWSYHTLSAGAARLFRLLGLHPGPDVSAAAAASLAGVSLGQLRPTLAELARAHLVTEHTHGRFTFHDLLRTYATELARTHDGAAERGAAMHRILDHYVHTAHAAALLLNPYRDVISPAPAAAGVRPEAIADDRQAMIWFSREYPVLLAVVDLSVREGLDIATWQLSAGVGTFCQRRGHWRDQVSLQTVALDATRRLADKDRQASAHRDLGRAYVRLGRDDDAHAEFRQALELYRGLGDTTGQAHIHNNVAEALDRQGRPHDALAHSRQAVDLFRAAGKRTGLAWALNGVGWLHIRLGNYEHAITYCEQALVLQREIDDRQGQGATCDSLGYAHHHLGHHTEALACFRRSLDLIREVGDRYQEADILTHIGETYDAMGDRPAARRVWQQAVAILDELGHADADRVRGRLRTLDQRRPQPAAAKAV